MKRIIEIIIKIINYVYNPTTSFKIHCWRDVIYSRWIAVNLLSADKVTLRYSITVIGGVKYILDLILKFVNFQFYQHGIRNANILPN